MSHVAIVYHSGFGHTKVVAERVKAGAEKVPGTQVRLLPVGEIDAHWTDPEGADAIVFGSPAYTTRWAMRPQGMALAPLR
jgi:multimeric flavodoxin WrbA